MGDFYYSFSWGEAEWRLRLGQRLDREGAQSFFFVLKWKMPKRTALIGGGEQKQKISDGGGCRRIGTPVNGWWQCEVMQPLGKRVGAFSNIKHGITTSPEIPLLGMYPK